MRKFWKQVLWKISGSKRDKIVGGYRKPHNELHSLHDEISHTHSMHEQKKRNMRILVGKQEDTAGKPTNKLRGP
jgi:hypothetical protein